MEVAIGRSKLKEFENLITEFQDQLFRFAFFRTGSFADSQDIVQEVFIKLYNDNGHITSINNMKSYLYKSISNACIDYHRKNKKLKFGSIDKAVIPDNMNEKDASEGLLQIEEYQQIEILLGKLPDEQAGVLRLRVIDELSFVEIASILKIPVTSVKSRFKYGIDKLKARILISKEIDYGL